MYTYVGLPSRFGSKRCLRQHIRCIILLVGEMDSTFYSWHFSRVIKNKPFCRENNWTCWKRYDATQQPSLSKLCSSNPHTPFYIHLYSPGSFRHLPFVLYETNLFFLQKLLYPPTLPYCNCNWNCDCNCTALQQYCTTLYCKFCSVL